MPVVLFYSDNNDAPGDWKKALGAHVADLDFRAGADRIGVDALFIADGILGADMKSDGFDEEAVARALDEYGVSARWQAPRLVW